MAVTTEDLLIQLQVDAKDTSNTLKEIKEQLKSLNKVQDDTAKSSKKTGDAVGGLGFDFIKLDSAVNLATKAFNLLSAPINRALDEATKAQSVFDKFAISMKFFGGAELAKSTKGLNDLADSMEAATGVDGDALLALAGRGAALGLTNTELEKLITGATDLAGLMGGDVSTAGEALLNSLNGQTKALAKYVPEVLNLKQGQLEAGAAIGQTAEKLKGLGSAFGGTAQGIEARFNAKVGKAFEELGKTIQQSFNLIEGKKLALNFLDDVIKAIEDTRAYIVGFFKTMAELDWESIGKAVGALSLAFLSLKAAIIVTQVGFIALAKAAWIAVAPLALVALKAIAIGVAVVGAVAIIEIAARNFSQLGTLASIAFIKIEQAVLKARIAFNEFTGDTGEADALNKRLEESKKRSEELGSSLKLDLGVSGKVISTITEAVKNFSGNVEQAKTPINGVGDALGKMGDKGVSKIREVNDAAKSAIEALKQMANVQGPRNEVDTIQAKAAQDRLKIEQEYQKVVDGTSNKQAVAQAQSLRNQAIQNSYQDAQFQIAEKYKGALDEINGKNKELALVIKNNGALQQDIIQNNLRESLDAIEKDRQARIKALGSLTPEMEASFKAQAEAQKKIADEAAKNAPSRAFEAPKKQGEDIGKAISGELNDGVFGAAMGAMSGIGAAVSAAQAVVDIVPNMLNGIANLIGSITELPMKILEGVTKIISGIAGFLTNFIANIGQMVTGILDAIVGLIVELPKLIVNFITQIPKIIGGIISALPDIIQALVTGLVEGVPMIALGLIEFLIKDAPKIAIQMVKVLAIQLPIAIVKGIINAIKNIFGAIGRLFSGGSVFKDAGQTIAKGFSAGLKKLSGVGAKIFEVKDLAENALGPAADKANQLLEQINAAGEDAFGWITKAWIWVRDNILMPLWNLIVLPFKYAWENLKIVFAFAVELLKGAWEGLKAVAYFVKDIFMAVWNFIKGGFEVIGDMFKAVFNFVVGLFSDPIQAFKDLWEDLKSIFGKIIENFTGFFSNVGDAIGGFGKRMWDGFKDALGDGVKFFSDLGGNIWNGLKAGLNGIVSFFTDLFKFEGGGEGPVEKFFGFDFPFFSFADGGLVPGVAPQKGDDKRNDIIPALLSPGEMVIPRSIVEDPVYRHLLESILNGEQIPGFFLGKLAKKVGGALKSGGSAVVGGINKVGDYIGDTASNVKTNATDIFKSLAKGDIKGVLKGAAGLLTAGVPKQILDMFNSVKRFVSDIDLAALISNPTAEIKRMIKDVGTTFLRDPFRELLDNFNPMAAGGLVGGGIPGKDSVPSMLMPGEFVMNRNAVSNIGLGNLNAMNSGQSMGSNYTFNIEMNVENKEPVDENFLRNRLIPRMQEELKRASMEGKFVISQKGVRNV
jgi:phage-related protein